MNKSVITTILQLFFLFSTIAPQFLQAQTAQAADVNVNNFPETQQIKGEVRVNNFPDVQQISGAVSVEGTTKFIKKEDLVVPTSARADLAEMVYAGTIETDGFTFLLIGLQGQIRSETFSPGTIGVVLVPDEKPILITLRDAKRIQFPIECKLSVKSGSPVFFESEQVLQRIAFARYKMYLYNTANKSVDANVYLYLSN